MKNLLSAVALAAVVSFSLPAIAHDYKHNGLVVDHPWARATPGQTPNGAAYMQLSIEGAEADRLLSATSPVAERVELHTHIVDDGVMRMRQVEAIEVAPGSPTILQPGGLHVMLLGLKAPLQEGESFPLTLTFENAGTFEVEVDVEAVGSMEPMHEGHDGHGS